MRWEETLLLYLRIYVCVHCLLEPHQILVQDMAEVVEVECVPAGHRQWRRLLHHRGGGLPQTKDTSPQHWLRVRVWETSHFLYCTIVKAQSRWLLVSRLSDTSVLRPQQRVNLKWSYTLKRVLSEFGVQGPQICTSQFRVNRITEVL